MAAGIETRERSQVDASVERQLADASRRIHQCDAGAGFLILGSVVCAYALLFALFALATQGADNAWPLAIRWVAYVVFVGLALVLTANAVRRVTRRVNPYYVARRLEETVPHAKNSVITWLDLRDETLPSAFRKTIGAKAAHDLQDADFEHVVNPKATWALGGVFAALLLGLLVLLIARPSQFAGLMQRAFLPFHHGQLAGATRITLLSPEAGDLVVTENQAVNFVVRIDGRVPEVNEARAPALLYRYQLNDKDVAQPLQQDGNGFWTTRLLPDQVGSTGFWYKITAGDAETPVYQVTVRAQPLVQRYTITYRYRPYLNLPPESIAFPNRQAALPFIKRHRGTDVTLTVHTNRAIRQGGVLLVTGKSKRDLPTQVEKDEPQAFHAQWALEQSGDFYVSFTSVDGERYVSRVPFPMEVLTDATPTVTLTQPKQDVELPANGTLEVAGTADDDLGLKDLTLRMQLLENGHAVPLKDQRYRPELSLDLDGKGHYPVHVDYLDIIALDQLKTLQGEPAKLSLGALVEYRLEATDNSDYPNRSGNVGKSATYKIVIAAPQDEASAQKQRENARKKQGAHNQQQDQHLAEQKHANDKNSSQPDQAGSKGNKEDADKAGQLKKDLDNELKKFGDSDPSSEKGEAKGDDAGHAEKKSGGDGADAPSPEQKNEKPGDPRDAGDTKGGSQEPGVDTKPGEPKDGSGANNDSKGQSSSGGSGQEPNAGQPQNDPGKGMSKGGPNDSAKDDGGASKADGPQPGATQDSAQKKDGPDAKMPDQAPQSKGSDAGPDGPSAQSKPGDNSANKAPTEGPSQGMAKGEDADGERSISKEKGPPTEKQSATANVKGDKSAGQEIEKRTGEAKLPPTDQAKAAEAGLTKGEGTEPKRSDPARAPTAEDIKHLKDLTERKGPVADLASKALEEMSKEATDPRIKALAKEALDQAGPSKVPGRSPEGRPDNTQTAATQPSTEPSPGDPGTTSKSGDNSPSPNARPGKGANTRPKGNASERKGTGGREPGAGAGPGDEGQGDTARKDLGRFGGNLQLEDFIKRATPEYRAKAGISEAEWQRLLAWAAEYDTLLRKMQKNARARNPSDARGAAGRFNGTGATQVQGTQTAADPLDPGQAETPPELRDAQHRFTTKAGERP